jgi:CubicO group peptidase (beta-lactamase class C family)
MGTTTNIRKLKARLLAGTAFVAACIPPLGTARSNMAAEVENVDQVCAVTYATVRAGRPSSSGGAIGCDGNAPPKQNAVFEAGSLSKPAFAYAVIKLVEEGVLDLDQPLNRYLPNGYRHRRNPFESDHAPVTDLVTASELEVVTARMLLNHTSGLPDWAGGRLVFEFSPGSRWQYSGEGYVLLQRVVEAITGEGLDAFMQRRVFGPLGMTHSAFRWTPQVGAALVRGWPAHLDFPEPIAAASLYTTAQDYARLVSALVNDKTALLLLLNAPVAVTPGSNIEWGLGWGVERTQNHTYLWQSGNGGTSGRNRSGPAGFAVVDAMSGDAVIVLTNSAHGLDVAQTIVTAVLPDSQSLLRSERVREAPLQVGCRNAKGCP